MKPLLVLVVGLLAVGCSTLTPEEKVVGEYEHKKRGHKYVFLENGAAEGYVRGNRQKAEEYKWSIVDGEIYVHWYGERIGEVYRINTDKSITWIADIDDGKRTELSNRHQATYKKIK